MAKSIMQTEEESYFSGRTGWLEKHHIFGGSNRKWSEKYGLWVWLTHEEHNEPPRGVHFNKGVRRALQREAQRAFEQKYPDLDFRAIFGKDYDYDDED